MKEARKKEKVAKEGLSLFPSRVAFLPRDCSWSRSGGVETVPWSVLSLGNLNYSWISTLKFTRSVCARIAFHHPNGLRIATWKHRHPLVHSFGSCKKKACCSIPETRGVWNTLLCYAFLNNSRFPILDVQTFNRNSGIAVPNLPSLITLVLSFINMHLGELEKVRLKYRSYSLREVKFLSIGSFSYVMTLPISMFMTQPEYFCVHVVDLRLGTASDSFSNS